MRMVVAMSGGVDSSVAAALSAEAGHDVIGVSMRTHRLPPSSNRACCTPDDMRDARRTAGHLGIPFYLLAYEDLFEREVIDPFVADYLAGRTPNPCVACNDRVNFAPLLERTRLLGASKLATGHYARTVEGADGEVELHRAVDADKDQTYFLYRLRQPQLRDITFPLGEMRKEAVREHALRLGLGERVAHKKESQEICFVGPGGYAAVVERRGHVVPSRGGNELVDADGRVLGHHGGVHHFTLGQRRGLGVASSQPMYVTHIDANSGRVTLGPRAQLRVAALPLVSTSWTGQPPESGRTVQVQLRHRGEAFAAVLEQRPGARAQVSFLEPIERASPGQAAVLFDGTRVLGGGVIAAPAA
jgi:tRNA-specific 2-thiouridylase